MTKMGNKFGRQRKKVIERSLASVVAIVGISGVGKTSLIKILKELLGAEIFLEPAWAELPVWIQRAFLHQKNLLKAHEWFWKRKKRQVLLAQQAKEQGRIALLDTSPLMNALYAKVFLHGKERQKMLKILAEDSKNLPKEDLTLMLKAPRHFIQKQVRKRGAEHEKSRANQAGNARMGKELEKDFLKKSMAKKVFIIRSGRFHGKNTESLGKLAHRIQYEITKHVSSSKTHHF